MHSSDRLQPFIPIHFIFTDHFQTMKPSCLFFILFFFSVFFTNAGNYIPPDQKYDAALEARIARADNESSGTDLSRTIYDLLRMADSLDDDHYYYKGKLYDVLGTIYFNMDLPDKSAKYYYEQLRIAQEHGYTFGMAEAYFNLGVNYLRIKQYKRASDFQQQALTFYKLSGVSDNPFLIRTSIELSKAEFYQKIYWKAEQRLTDLLRLRRSSILQKQNDRLNIYIALSELYMGKDDLARAAFYTDQVKALKDSSSSHFLKLLALQNIRNLLMRQQKWQEALQAADKEETYFRENHMENNSLNSLMKKIKILEALGKKEELLNAYRQMMTAREKLESPTVLSNVIGYEMDYELGRLNKQKGTELLLEKNEKTLFRTQSYLYLSIALLLILVVFALVVWNHNRQKIANLKIEKEVDEKQLAYEKLQSNNASLTEFALHAERMQDRLTELKNKVTEALSVSTDREKLHHIKNEINLELQHPALNPIELSHKVKSIKEELMFKLSKAHPTLTEKDRRLCILLMLNLSSKEMANILNIQEESVEKSRSRLRKKMNLSSTQNFIEYFNSIK